MDIAILSVRYDEPDPSTYRGIVLLANHKEKYRWASGDPVEDWKQAAIYANTQTEYFKVLVSSTVNDFLADGGRLEVT